MPPIPAASANPTPSPETAPVSAPAAAAPEGIIPSEMGKAERILLKSYFTCFIQQVMSQPL